VLPLKRSVLSLQVERGEVSPDKLSRKNLMTAVANHQQMVLGQKVRLEGRWIKHPKYGYQLQVRLSSWPSSRALWPVCVWGGGGGGWLDFRAATKDGYERGAPLGAAMFAVLALW